jgi:hypothetical protein
MTIRWTQRRDKYKRLYPKWLSSDGKGGIVRAPNGQFGMKREGESVEKFDSLEAAKKAYKEKYDG